MKKRFQIRITDKQGCGHFLYFDATEKTMIKIACETANADLNARRERDAMMAGLFHQSYKPMHTVNVVERDVEKKITKRGGIKFKLRLAYISAKINGNKVINDWYEPAE